MNETTTRTCQEFVSQGWRDHEGDSEGVLARLPEGIALASAADDLPRLAALIVHVSAEHLGRPAEGLALLDSLTRLDVHQVGSDADRAVLRSRAVLQRVAGDDAAAEASLAAAHQGSDLPEASTRARVLAVAASALAGQQRVDEASKAFEEAVGLLSYGPSKEDPAARALAITGNNLACALEEREGRTPAEDQLLELAAKTARTWWEVAGTWVQVKIAEYRLAMTHLALGRAEEATEHANLALELCDTNGADDGARFFPLEALARARHAAGDAEGARTARDQAAKALEAAGEGDREWFAGALNELDALLA